MVNPKLAALKLMTRVCASRSLAVLRCPDDRRQFEPVPGETGRAVQFSYCAEMNSDPSQPASIVAADLNLNDLVYYPDPADAASWVPEEPRTRKCFVASESGSSCIPQNNLSGGGRSPGGGGSGGVASACCVMV